MRRNNFGLLPTFPWTRNEQNSKWMLCTHIIDFINFAPFTMLNCTASSMRRAECVCIYVCCYTHAQPCIYIESYRCASFSFPKQLSLKGFWFSPYSNGACLLTLCVAPWWSSLSVISCYHIGGSACCLFRMIVRRQVALYRLVVILFTVGCEFL
jgi:hypothetical protein